MSKDIFLRRVKIDDAKRIQSWMNDPESIKYLGYGFLRPRSLGDIREEIQLELDGEFSSQRYAIVDENGDYLGEIGLILPDARALTAEVTIVLLKGARGGGIAKKALNLLMNIAFNEIGYKRLHARVISQNLPAVKLFERAGFVKEGTLRQHMLTQDGLSDITLFGLLKEEYDKTNTRGAEK